MTAVNTSPNTAALNRLFWRWAVVIVILIIFATWAAWRMNTAAARLPLLTAAASRAAPAAPQVEYWTCSMHPEVEQSEPGQCPVCSMELIPKYAGSDMPGVMPEPVAHVHDAAKPAPQSKMWYRCTMPECGDVGSDDPESRCPVCGMKRESVGMTGSPGDGDDFSIELGERARRLAEIAAEPVQPRLLFKKIRTVGKIGYDETRHKMVSAWIDGRIDKLFADFTGMVVRAGDHLVEIYSPELLSAQEEYLQARRAAELISERGVEASRRSAAQLVRSSRRKLELLGITPAQIESIEQSGQPQIHLVVHAPIGGTIVAKRAMEGMYTKTGDALYEIADLTHVWLLLDVYETDLPWIQPFQNVSVTSQALPGEQFLGRIAFVDPVVNPTTRTIAVRVNVPNPERRLKPEMFVTAEINVSIGAGGKAVAPTTDAAFACPMHPWETAGDHADCPVCEMAMVPITAIPGFVSPTEPQAVLGIPREAVLQTGERALAYIEIELGVYRPAEVLLGPLARDENGREFYPVLAGLIEGQRVVTRGNFAIDSQMQLAGKPSLFQTGGAQAGHHSMHAMEDMDHMEDQDQMGDRPPADQSDDIQTVCPVMGNEIVEDVYTDYLGVRIYFCCPPCIAKFNADPDQYIPKLPEQLQARIRAAREDRSDD